MKLESEILSVRQVMSRLISLYQNLLHLHVYLNPPRDLVKNADSELVGVECKIFHFKTPRDTNVASSGTTLAAAKQFSMYLL